MTGDAESEPLVAAGEPRRVMARGRLGLLHGAGEVVADRALREVQLLRDPGHGVPLARGTQGVELPVGEGTVVRDRPGRGVRIDPSLPAVHPADHLSLIHI